MNPLYQRIPGIVRWMSGFPVPIYRDKATANTRRRHGTPITLVTVGLLALQTYGRIMRCIVTTAIMSPGSHSRFLMLSLYRDTYAATIYPRKILGGSGRFRISCLPPPPRNISNMAFIFRSAARLLDTKAWSAIPNISLIGYIAGPSSTANAHAAGGIGNQGYPKALARHGSANRISWSASLIPCP